MPTNGRGNLRWTLGAAVLAFLAATAMVSGRSDRSGPASAGVKSTVEYFTRPGTAEIRQVTDQVLKDPRFSPHKSLWQLVKEWLGNKFRNWKGPNVPSGLAHFLMWFFIVWSVIALVAILGDLVWTVMVLWRGRSRYGSAGSGAGGPGEAIHALSLEELLVRMRGLAEHEEYRPALAMMLLALLRILDHRGQIRFHESKTNGDYLLEYPVRVPGGPDFRTLIGFFDATVYGGRPCDRRTYQDLHTLFERIETHGARQP